MRLGFEREGMTVESAESAAAASFDDVAVVVAGVEPGVSDAAPFIRELVQKGAGAAPILYVGNGISHTNLDPSWQARATQGFPLSQYSHPVPTSTT